MKILILGGDGYLGWPTAIHFSKLGYDVGIVDSLFKRHWELEMGISPLVPISTLQHRIETWQEVSGKKIKFWIGDITDHRFMYKMMENFLPDAIIHYAEQPSAPYSMYNRGRAVYTQVNNIVGTLNLLFAMKKFVPNAHLVKLGTMGEYGTPNIDIEEGFIKIDHNNRVDILPFPKKPGSFYHLSKVHDSHNIHFACDTWGLRATDLNQGIVYGIDTEETILHPKLNTSFHYDHIFGTVINRFCTQAAAGMPLTVYGKGSQKRTFLNILDTLQCVKIAVENPAEKGEYRVFNQFTEIFSPMELAQLVKDVGEKLGLKIEINNIENPRIEKEEHYYNPKNEKFQQLGLKPQYLSETLLNSIIKKVTEAKENIDTSIIMPSVKWRE